MQNVKNAKQKVKTDYNWNKIAQDTHFTYQKAICETMAERQAKQIAQEKAAKLEKINNEIYRKLDDLKYSYSLEDEEVSVIHDIKEELTQIKTCYDRVISMHRNKTFAFFLLPPFSFPSTKPPTSLMESCFALLIFLYCSIVSLVRTV